jgi:hypothetical protein
MDYDEHIRYLYKTVPGFSAAVDVIEGLSNKRNLRILNFSHHDLDGIACAFILRRLLEKKLKATVVTKMPAHFRLWEETLTDALKEGEKFDLLIVSDKGTFADYDDLLKHIKDILIIDHHQLDGKPTKCTVFNPTVEVSEYASAASLLCHMLSRKLGATEAIDDFAALIGCRGDFAFDPVERTFSDFAQPFLEMAKEKFPPTFEVKTSRPTMYDLLDRSRTALINQLGEVLQVGTLGHLYNEILGLDIVSGPMLVYDYLNELDESGVNLAQFESVESFLEQGPNGKIISQIFEQFKKDWELLERRSEHTLFLGELRGVGIYMVFAQEVDAMNQAPFPAILPFVASTRMELMKRKGGHPHAMVIVFCPKKRGIHISMRGGGGIINCGKMCFELSKRLQNIYPQYKGIGGGGHGRAAELLADNPTPMYSVMHELLLMMEDMIELSRALDKDSATSEQVEKAKVLGIIN